MKYKAEVCTLLIAMCLFVVSAFFYSHSQDLVAAESQAVVSLEETTYPYRGYGLASVAFGTFFMTSAAISYSKRSEKGFDNRFVLAKNKADEQPN